MTVVVLCTRVRDIAAQLAAQRDQLAAQPPTADARADSYEIGQYAGLCYALHLLQPLLDPVPTA
jgi:hypothetical protein